MEKGQNETLKLWDIEGRSEIDSIEIDGWPTSLAVHGDLVIIGNANCTITVYQVK